MYVYVRETLNQCVCMIYMSTLIIILCSYNVFCFSDDMPYAHEILYDFFFLLNFDKNTDDNTYYIEDIRFLLPSINLNLYVCICS